MRALYYPELSELTAYQISGDAHHHLVNVVRVQVGDEILLLNGKGLSITTRVESISKKIVLLQFQNQSLSSERNTYDLALGIPKKDSLELCLKQATELGFRRIFLIRSEFSQSRLPESERLLSLLISALEQSNSAYLPEIITGEWTDIPWTDYQSALLLSSQSKSSENTAHAASRLLIVGPEGGFSEKELTLFSQRAEIEIMHLPTPILRTSTAVATGAGILLERLMD